MFCPNNSPPTNEDWTQDNQNFIEGCDLAWKKSSLVTTATISWPTEYEPSTPFLKKKKTQKERKRRVHLSAMWKHRYAVVRTKRPYEAKHLDLDDQEYHIGFLKIFVWMLVKENLKQYFFSKQWNISSNMTTSVSTRELHTKVKARNGEDRREKLPSRRSWNQRNE